MQAFKKVSTKPLTEWLVIILDKPGDRSKIRPEHLKKAAIPMLAGKVTNCGAVLNKVPKDDNEKLDFAGSSYNILAESKDEIIEFLKKDPFAINGIWDFDNVIIYPYKCFARIGKDIPK
ncbi:unnamed protein product [[Candida] boidinii]|uniref:Unnamed protein product n=1 Tax=Candida boidinii TaxID=5477 RepID=A0A9W6T4X5_CANBO|nr:unnamed protein product [[Candida] boidinii]